MNCPECGSDQASPDGDLAVCLNCGTEFTPDPQPGADDDLWRDGIIRKG